MGKYENGRDVINKFTEHSRNNFDSYRQALLEANLIGLIKLKYEAYSIYLEKSPSKKKFINTTFWSLQKYAPELVKKMKLCCCRAWYGIKPLVYNKIKTQSKYIIYKNEIISEVYLKLCGLGTGWFFVGGKIIVADKGAHNKAVRANRYREIVNELVYRAYAKVVMSDHGTYTEDERISLDALDLKEDYENPVSHEILEKVRINPIIAEERRIFREQAIKNLLENIFEESRIDIKVLKECLRYHFGKYFHNAVTGAVNIVKHRAFELQYVRYLLRKYIYKYGLNTQDFIDEENLIYPTVPKILANYLDFKYNEDDDLDIHRGILELKDELYKAAGRN